MPNTNTAPSSSGLTATAADPNLDIFAAGPPSVTASTHPIPAPSPGPAPAAATAATPASLPTAATNTTTTMTSTQSKLSAHFDDLDDDFEGLEDAKEGSADDDFATISRSGLDDFNPVFDSSPPPSQAKSESTAFGAESSFDFANVSDGSGAQHSGNNLISPMVALAVTSGTATTSTTTKAPLSPGDNQDWEALFAGLDSPGSDGTAKEAAKDAQKEGDRPAQPSRALTDGTHDEPTLKQLMAMGYQRADALEALEKSNYDAERAVEILLSK